MASRNERKRAAKARKLELLAAVESAFAIETEKQAAIAARKEALIAVNQWTKPGTRTVCNPGDWWQTPTM